MQIEFWKQMMNPLRKNEIQIKLLKAPSVNTKASQSVGVKSELFEFQTLPLHGVVYNPN